MLSYKIVSVTVNRSDFSRMLPLYNLINNDQSMSLDIVATASHFDDGRSIDDVRRSGLSLLEMPIQTDQLFETNAALLSSLGRLLLNSNYDLMLILGDRHEMLAVCMAALQNNIPIAHVGGGYKTLGAIDDRIRHAITKLSHLHYVANNSCRNRLLQMGELEEQVVVSGAPDLDALRICPKMSREQVFETLELDPTKPFLLSTVHPETTGDFTRDTIHDLFQCFADYDGQIVITAPAAENGQDLILKAIESLCDKKEDVTYRPTLG